MTQRVRVTRPVTRIPKTIDEATKCVQEIGEAQREAERLQSKLNDRIAQLTEATAEGVNPLKERVQRLLDGLFEYAQSHRDELTEQGKQRTVTVASGQFGWRVSPPSLVLRDPETVLSYLREKNLPQFIRTKEELDKKALLQAPEIVQSIPDVTIERKERFFVAPTDVAKALYKEDALKKETAPSESVA